MNKEKAERIIRTRTSKIVGGYITEILFSELMNQKYPNLMYSRGWWGGLEYSDSGALVFFVVKQELNKLDQLLIKVLEAGGYECKQVFLEGDKIMIRDHDTVIARDDFIKQRSIRASHDPDMEYRPRCYDQSMDKCIHYYEKAGLLEEIASSIYIEDHFLNVYYTVSNIDFICMDNKGKPFYVEVKFKNEFRKQCDDGIARLVFGIDEFQYDYLFDAFFSCGLSVVNVVLYNDSKEQDNTSSTVIFDYLTNRAEEDFLWKVARIEDDKKYERYTFFAKHTSWYGNSGRTVCCIPLTEYRDLKSAEGSSELRHMHGWGKCNKCGGTKVIRINRRTCAELFVCNKCGEIFEYKKK